MSSGTISNSSKEATKDFWRAIAKVMSMQNQAPLVSTPHKGSIPLSFAQERLWFLEQLAANSAYNMPFAFHLEGALDISALQQSLNEIIRRHEVLRTTFSVVEGKPVQTIQPPKGIPLAIIELKASQQQELQQLIAQKVEQPFDLSKEPVIRASLIRLKPNEYLLLMIAHHIAVDFWSKKVLFNELSQLYQAFSAGKSSPLPDMSLQYADFAVWQRQWLKGACLDLLLDYWKQQLNSISELQIPTDTSTPSPSKGTHQKLKLPQQLSNDLKGLARQQRVTLFVVLLAAFKVLLHRYTQQDDISLCSPVANRNRPEVKGLIGYFVNLLILRTDLSGNPTFQELLTRISQMVSGAYAHQDLPIQQLVQSLNLRQTPLSRVMFGLQNTGVHNLVLSELEVEALDVDGGAADFDLYLYVQEEQEGLAAILKYNPQLWSAATISKMLDHFQTVLENIVAHPQQRVAQLLTLTETEQHWWQQNKSNSTNSKPNSIYVAPRNQLELQLTQIWSKVLGIEKIGVKDNFFALGGESLLAMSLFAEIEQTFGKSIPLSTLLGAPTVEFLANILAQSDESNWSSLVPMQTRGSKPPFFCIHGQQGNVLNFQKLAHYLGNDQPFYSLQTKGLDGKELPYFRIEDMAAHYIREIRSIQSEGPYFLGGNSMGGTVAFEMSQQLQQQGEQVALLVMFDTFGIDCFPRVCFRWQHYWRYLLQLGVSKAMFDDLTDVLERKFLEITSRLYLKLGRTLPQHLSRVLIAEANMQAKREYRAKAYSGKVLLIRASEPASFDRPYLPTAQDWHSRDALHGWGELINGGLELIDVPGDHYSIFKEPHVQILAQKLKTYLQQFAVG